MDRLPCCRKLRSPDRNHLFASGYFFFAGLFFFGLAFFATTLFAATFFAGADFFLDVADFESAFFTAFFLCFGVTAAATRLRPTFFAMVPIAVPTASAACFNPSSTTATFVFANRLSLN
jgi:hypothetical protein